jgi:hypothetical protein
MLSKLGLSYCMFHWPWRLGARRYSSYSFLTSGLDGCEWSASRPGSALPRGKTPSTHCTGGWVDPRAGLDTEARGKILCPCWESNPDRPVVQSVVRHYTAWATPASFRWPLGSLILCLSSCTVTRTTCMVELPGVNTRSFIAVCTAARHWSLFWAYWIHSPSQSPSNPFWSHPPIYNSVFRVVYFLPAFAPKPRTHYSPVPCVPHAPPTSLLI